MKNNLRFQLPPIPKPGSRCKWQALHGCTTSIAIYQLASNQSHPLLIITPDLQKAEQLRRELNYLNHNHELSILLFPDWEILPYDHFSAYQDLISERLYTLYRLPQLQRGIIIAAASTLMHRLPPKDYVTGYSFVLNRGEILDRELLRKQLTNAGYRHVDQVMQHGEFSYRGSIIDIYPMGSKLPYRIELFDQNVETLRSFDPDSQRSIEKIEQIRLLPAKEYPFSEENIIHFREKWREKFSGNPTESPIYQNISHGQAAPGIEYYLPLFFDKMQTIFAYLPEHTSIISIEALNQPLEKFWQDLQYRYEQMRYDITRPLCAPHEVALPVNEFFQYLKDFPCIVISTNNNEEKTASFAFHTQPAPQLLVDHKAKQPLRALEEFLINNTNRILLCTESDGRREVLLDLLAPINIKPRIYSHWENFLTGDDKIGIIVTPWEQGAILQSLKITILTENHLFAVPVSQRRSQQRKALDPNTIIRDLTELNIGAAVVHIEHGVGRYQGLKTIKTGDIEAEYLTLSYADDDKIYVPVSSLHLISRYTGSNPDNAPLQKLGTKQWQKIKERASKRVRDIAAELLALYSQREASIGHAFSNPDADFQTFRQAFVFEETADQKTAIDAVIADMVRKRSMDRLICGDVGFGKTEVAMQAAFLAIQDEKQVAVLTPTTLLAAQHTQTFQDRFADWPVKIATLSRLQNKKQQEEIIAQLKTGGVDIIIGTHKLLQETIKFKDLGLLIVDEEHRFGVRQKEQIKALRAHVDILTLTATPIPRTLNMALAGSRDLSLITTPPQGRLAIKTFVYEYSNSIIREAILREILRGGQVYILHNDIATIQATAEKIKNVVPQIHIAVAHGQMHERELERVMSDFYHQKYNVLVCTTIIESGIDIPTANTIIIHRADRLGLAQLHQLRGRVGRSHHQAYAYLLTPQEKALTSDAKKRLGAIAEMEELGAGFYLATHDLEIRGAGEILGEEQSGHIDAIGFTLYMELLEQAIKSLKEGQEPNLEAELPIGPEIDLHVSTLIPEDYVFDVHTRLSLYKRLSNCENKEAIQNFKIELIDRFGPLPEATQHLLTLTELKLLAQPLGIKKIDIGKQFGYLHFIEKPNIDPIKILQLIQKQSEKYQLQGPQRLRFKIEKPEFAARMQAVIELLQFLSKN